MSSDDIYLILFSIQPEDKMKSLLLQQAGGL